MLIIEQVNWLNTAKWKICLNCVSSKMLTFLHVVFNLIFLSLVCSLFLRKNTNSTKKLSFPSSIFWGGFVAWEATETLTSCFAEQWCGLLEFYLHSPGWHPQWTSLIFLLIRERLPTCGTCREWCCDCTPCGPCDVVWKWKYWRQGKAL